MKNAIIAFIGAGAMARSLVSGLITNHYDPDCIWVCDPHLEKLEFFAQRLKVHTSSANENTISSADIVLFAVKPQSTQKAMSELAEALLKKKPLIISIAAGIGLDQIEQWLKIKHAIVRCMPNTPASVCCGATALYANTSVSEKQKKQAEAIMQSVGITVWLSQEDQINAVTALSGSGPAYFFLLMEALIQTGQSLGLSLDVARLLTLQTALGAAKMALSSADSLEQLRQHVTSPGGTTEQALKVFEKNNFPKIVMEALAAAEKRARELSV